MTEIETLHKVADEIMEEIASDLDVTMEDMAWRYVEGGMFDTDNLNDEDMTYIVSVIVDNWRYSV